MKIENIFPNQNQNCRSVLGLYFERKRRESGMSLKELALKMAITPQGLKRIEAGRMKVTQAVFEKAITHLALDPEELLEIGEIARVSYINEIAQALAPNFPA